MIATALLTASGASFAHDRDYGYGRVVSVEPQLSISFGSPYPDGFRVLYESGGSRYWTHTTYYPRETIVLPPAYEVHRVYYRDDRRGWDGPRRGWEDRRDGGWRGEGRWHRRHHDDDDD
jgi:hypothetical protein